MENISETNKGGLYGWICPVCGRGNSPFTSTCPCKPIKCEITYSPAYVYTGPTPTTKGVIK